MKGTKGKGDVLLLSNYRMIVNKRLFFLLKLFFVLHLKMQSEINVYFSL